MSEEKYKSFFDEIEKFKTKQTQQKQRGLNNYNILTSVLKPHDEVRLHSGMIYSLLNPNGEHFQDTLFLEKFLEILEIDNFLNLSNCYIYKEYRGVIDLYITDGNKHIIIENKVYSSDQFEQIKRYIEIIQKENKDLEADDILVVYLSLDRKVPSKESLGNLELNNNYLRKGSEDIAKYKYIFYKNEISKWLKKCQYEVQNITNLNEAIRQYIDVVKIISNKREDKVMSLISFLKSKEQMKIAGELYDKFPEVIKTRYEPIIIEKIGNMFKEKFEEIKEVKPLDINKYKGAHYVNLKLNNKVIIQLEYYNHFKLFSINTQYHECDNKEIKASKQLNTRVNIDFNVNNFYEFLVDTKEIERVCSEHGQKLLVDIIHQKIDENKNI